MEYPVTMHKDSALVKKLLGKIVRLTKNLTRVKNELIEYKIKNQYMEQQLKKEAVPLKIPQKPKDFERSMHQGKVWFEEKGTFKFPS